MEENSGLPIQWDYQGHKGDGKYQKDWNQTLVTWFNKIGFKEDKVFNVKVPNNLKSIIQSLEYYKGGMVANKYDIEFIDEDSKVIMVGDTPITVINFK